METTLFNFYVDEDKSDAHVDTVKLFNEAYTSDYVTNELMISSET